MLRLNSKEAVPYTLSTDKSDKPATFLLRQISEKKFPLILPLLNKFQQLIMRDDMSEAEIDEVAKRTPANLLLNATEEQIEVIDALTTEALRLSVVGWDNITDSKGEVLPFSQEALQANLGNFPFVAKIEVAFNAISLTTGGTLSGE